MATIPNIFPASETSAILVSSSASVAEVASFAFPFNIYGSGGPLYSEYFLSGCAEQVAFTYKKLGGDAMGIELTNGNVFSSYEEAVLEYSNIVNMHQAKNSLGSAMGSPTASFNEKGEAISGSSASLKFPKFSLAYSARQAQGISEEAGFGGTLTEYSASIVSVVGQQDYNVYAILSGNLVNNPNLPYAAALGPDLNARVRIRRVYYISPRAMWRFFGYYGGLNVVGNLSNYGQYSDASTFEVVPTWQHKLQAMAYEDSIKTRISQYSFEVTNNKIRLFPTPIDLLSPSEFWFTFTVAGSNVFDDDPNQPDSRLNGVNNVNTLPFGNLPYEHINSMGKQWIRKFALALTKEVLGQVRGKFGNKIPIAGDDVSLNADALLGQAKDEQDKLREELIKMLDELSYDKLAEMEKNRVQNITDTYKNVQSPIFMG